jgi:hypothetical protein
MAPYRVQCASVRFCLETPRKFLRFERRGGRDEPSSSDLTRSKRIMPARALALDELPPEVVVGREQIVRGAAQRDIRRPVLSPASEWQQMMQLQTMRFTATLPCSVHERTAR